MEIRDFLAIGTSRLNADILVNKLEEDPFLFDEIWSIMTEDIYPLSMRASWVIGLFAAKHPYFLEPRIPEIVSLLGKIKTESVHRNLAKILTFVPLPIEQAGILFDYCYSAMESPRASIAVKAYSMTILYNISNMEPELKPELFQLLDSLPDESAAGIRSRAGIILRKLRKDARVR